MGKKRKPHEERKPEDYRDAADDSLELAKVLVGQGAISDEDFLELMAHSDDLVDHDGETCGMCHNMTPRQRKLAFGALQAGLWEITIPPTPIRIERFQSRSNSARQSVAFSEMNSPVSKFRPFLRHNH